MIDRATLLKIARATAAQRMQARPSLISAYLTGSIAANEPPLGDATDIDLIFIDAAAPSLDREVTRLNDQVALDIQYRTRADYANPKQLRVHPWRGPEMCEPFFILDPQHFFELAQASARGQFHRPDFSAARARAFITLARDSLGMGLLLDEEAAAPVTLEAVCQALAYAANALISLNAFPAGPRRLTIKLAAAAQKLGRAEVYDQFIALFGESELEAAQVQVLLTHWSAAYRAGQTVDHELIHPARRGIYERGFQAQLQNSPPANILWLMLYTWQALLKYLPGDSPEADHWVTFLEHLRLADPADFTARVRQARAYITLAAETVESWAEHNGA